MVKKITKSDLVILREHKQRMDGLHRAIADLRATVTDTSVHLSDMPRSGQYHDAFAEFVAKKEAIEIRLMQVEAEYMEKYADVEEGIMFLPFAQQKVIRMRYEKAMSWREISQNAHYAKSYCKTLHRKALERLDPDPE